jgi:hypothetical protein
MKSSIVSEILETLQDQVTCSDCECEDEDQDSEEELTVTNIIFPVEYEDMDDEDQEEMEFALFKYKDPTTNEIFFFDRTGLHKKDGQQLLYMGRAEEYRGRKVKLNKPFRTPDGPKKFAVYVKNKAGKVVIVRFGDPNMSIKKNNPERRKSFRARHKCDQKKDKTTPGYWSCKMW